MGQPEFLSDKDIERLEKASQLVSEKLTVNYDDGTVFLKVRLAAHAVAAITIEFKPRRASR